MNRSDTISELATALAEAQGEFKAATKSRANPHLHSQYATLDDIIAAVRAPLANHGLSFLQPLNTYEEGFVLETLVLHQSGEWIGCEAVIPNLAGNRGVNELQAFGGALTYMRRYMLASLLGINTEEDGDGNGTKKAGAKKAVQKQGAGGNGHKAKTVVAEPPAELTAEYIKQYPEPTDWLELYTVAALAIGFKHKKHASTVVESTLDKEHRTIPAAWQVLVDHKLSKFAEDAKEPVNA